MAAHPNVAVGRTLNLGAKVELQQPRLECGTEVGEQPAGLFPLSQARPEACAIDTRSTMLMPRGACRQRDTMAAAEDVAALIDKLRREGPPPGLLPTRSANLRAKRTPRGELLTPARPARGRAISAEEHAQLPQELARLWRTRTAAMGAPPPSHGVPGEHLAAGVVEVGVDLAGWACDCEGTYDCALRNRIHVRYGEVDRCIDADWFWEHHDAQDWLDEDDCVEILWNGFKSHGEGVDREKFNEVLKCWMIDLQKAQSGRSYRLFFEKRGGPREALYHACDLVARFQTYARESWSGSDACEHFHNFIGDVLRGDAATSREYEKATWLGTEEAQHGPCQLSILVVSTSTDVTPRAVTTCDRETPDVCHQSDEDGHFYGGQFDDWSADLTSKNWWGTDYWSFYERASGSRSGPHTSPAASASPTGFAVRLPAVRIAWEGFVLDYAISWARVALQYALEEGDVAAFVSAWKLARAGAARLPRLGRLLIHEIGHVFMGTGGHCVCDTSPSCGCCFDMAAEAWVARVQARLGLPDSDTFVCSTTLLSQHSDSWGCGTASGGFAYYPWTTSFEEACVPRASVTLSGGPCFVA